MKKWIALLLSCVMLLAMVAGCGGTPAESPSQSGGAGETAPQSAAPDGETKTYKVGFSNVWVGNTWGVQCVNELEAYLRNNEQISEYYIYNADNDVNKQISDIEDLIAKGVDMLILQPISAESVAAVVEEAYDAGIVVVNCTSPCRMLPINTTCLWWPGITTSATWAPSGCARSWAARAILSAWMAWPACPVLCCACRVPRMPLPNTPASM